MVVRPNWSGVNPQGSRTGTDLWEVGALRSGPRASTGARDLGFSWRYGPRPRVNTGARNYRVTGA